MSTLAAKVVTWANPLEVFRARCIARATLVASCDDGLITAVDALQAAAVQTGLVDKLGQDEVQRLMSEAFAAVPADIVVDVVPDIDRADDLDQHEAPERGGAVPKSTIDAAEYLVRLGDRARLRKWLDGRSAEECAAIRKHLKAK